MKISRNANNKVGAKKQENPYIYFMNSRRNFIRLSGALAAVKLLNQSFTWQPTDFTKKNIKPARLKKGDKVAITSPGRRGTG